MRVFITGSTGLLGSNIVNELLNEGHQIKALVRSLEKAQSIYGPNVDLVEGDLQNVDKFSDSLKDIDVLIHAAACYSEFYKKGSNSPLYETNVHGTISLLEAAYKNSVSNIVYISSAGVLEMREEVDESTPYSKNMKDHYFNSKIEAEKQIDRFLELHKNMRLIKLLPTVMIGPSDMGPTPNGNLILNFLKGEMKIILPGSINIVDARDVAKAAVNAMKKGKRGERYIIGGKRYKFKDYFESLAAVSEKPVLTKQPPVAALKIVATIMYIKSIFTGKAPALRISIIKRLQTNFRFNSSKAKKELEVTFRPLEETLADTVQWFETNGYY